MKRQHLFPTLILLALAIPALHAQNQTQTVTAKLTEASVYLRGATLTHTASVQLKSGAQTVVVNGLSPEIEIASLKVTVSGNNILSSAEFSNDYVTVKSESAKIQQLRDSLKLHQKKWQEINNSLSVNNKLLKILSDGITNNTQQKDKIISSTELSDNMDLYKAKAPALMKQQNELKEQQEAINQHISRLQKQIKQDESRERQHSGVVTLAVSAPVAAKADITITYYTAKASWTPCYDIQVPAVGKPVSLMVKAQVRQTTGLDWKQVKLNLSNAHPNQSNQAPLFSAWFLRLQSPGAAFSRKSAAYSNTLVSYKTAEAEVDEDASDEIQEVKAPKSMDDLVELQENDIEASYAIALPYNIPGNGKAQLIDLKTHTLKADYYYYAAPKLASETYLMVTLSDWEQYRLLPGEANVVFNGTHTGKTRLNTGTTEPLTLTLATEPRIVVKREKRTDFSSTKTLGGSTTATRSHLITVKSNMNHPVSLRLKEQYPLSTDKEMEVKLTENSPEAGTNNSDLGVLTWDFELKAGESRTFTVTYTVKYPKEKRVILE
ncbi:MAG: DUF4139 domain-containing protein [Bacteroidales bacterium]|nr:DUF4139 domain-containing protein [Bacteroidales bacterium]MBR6920265.1 DUF4139 domain-containing protein [Bacteroidales bacterium]